VPLPARAIAAAQAAASLPTISIDTCSSVTTTSSSTAAAYVDSACKRHVESSHVHTVKD
jgi:hypothetical protein